MKSRQPISTSRATTFCNRTVSETPFFYEKDRKDVTKGSPFINPQGRMAKIDGESCFRICPGESCCASCLVCIRFSSVLPEKSKTLPITRGLGGRQVYNGVSCRRRRYYYRPAPLQYLQAWKVNRHHTKH